MWTDWQVLNHTRHTKWWSRHFCTMSGSVKVSAGCLTCPYYPFKIAQHVKSLISSVQKHQKEQMLEKAAKSHRRIVIKLSSSRFTSLFLLHVRWIFRLFYTNPNPAWTQASICSFILTAVAEGKPKHPNIVECGVIHAGPPGGQFNVGLEQISRLKLNSVITVMGLNKME